MSRESEQQKFDNVVKELRMTQRQASEFHEYLGRHYRLEKDNMSYQRLLEVGREYLSQ